MKRIGFGSGFVFVVGFASELTKKCRRLDGMRLTNDNLINPCDDRDDRNAPMEKPSLTKPLDWRGPGGTPRREATLSEGEAYVLSRTYGLRV
jgi:hypothetical protein